GPISKISLESKLEQMGCVTRSKIIIEDENGMFVRFINISLPDGGTCYVDLDVEGYVPYEDDITSMRETESNFLSHSRKIGDLKLTYPETEGVIFECDTMLVVLYMEEEAKP